MKPQKKDLLFSNKALALLIFPLLVEQLLAILVGMADSIMIASVGEAAVSGVSLVDSVMNLFITLFSAMATGGAVVAGQYLGQKNEKSANKAAVQLIQFIVVTGLIITAALYMGKNFILTNVFGAIDADVKGHANTYLLIVSASVPFIALYNSGAALFRTMGNSRISMVVSVIMNIINVGGNAILIYGCHMGTEGVAIPTLVSRMAAAIMIMILLMRSKGMIRLELNQKPEFDWGMVKRILKIGVPNGLENGMFQLGKILVLSLVSTFGTSAIAANAVANVVAVFQVLPGVAINLAVTPVISRCVGASKYDQAEYYTKKLTGIMYVASAVTNILIYLALPLILRLYGLTDQTAKMAHNILSLHTVAAIAIWPLAFSLPCSLRAAGDAKVPMYVSIISMWIFRIAFSYILGKYAGMELFGVWVSMVIDWCVRAPLMVIRYRQGKWKQMKVV